MEWSKEKTGVVSYYAATGFGDRLYTIFRIGSRFRVASGADFEKKMIVGTLAEMKQWCEQQNEKCR